jgi:tetratricopeptide (TPR) repeat protein
MRMAWSDWLTARFRLPRLAWMALAMALLAPAAARALTNEEWEAQANRLVGNRPALESLAKRWVTEHPDSYYGLMILGEVQCHLDEVPAALDAFQRAATVEPHNKAPWEQRAACLGAHKDFPAAIAAAKHETAVAPDDGEAWLDLGVQLNNLAMKQMVDRNIGLMTMMDAETKQAFDDSAAAVEQAIHLGVRNPSWAWNLLGVDRYRAGEDIPAIKAFMESLHDKPGDPYSLNGIALANGHLKSLCTRTQTRPGAPGYQIITRYWTCDEQTHALSQQVDALITGR